MKKIAVTIGCLIPLFSFAAPADMADPVDSYQELCAKERDPIKRQNYCHILDKYSQTTMTVSGHPEETVTV